MKRREFTKIAAGLAGLLAAPFRAAVASQPVSSTGHRPTATITRLRVGTWRTADLRHANRLALEAGLTQPWPDPPDDEDNYWAELIKDGDRHFYRAGETTIEISEYEYERVLVNPNMYYFSKALEVNYRFQQKRNGLPGLG